MTLKASIIAAGVLAAGLCVSTGVAAQQDDIGNRSQAAADCAADPNYLGYGNEEVCTEARYQELQQNSQWSNGEGSSGPSRTNFDNRDDICNSAATRVQPERCRN